MPAGIIAVTPWNSSSSVADSGFPVGGGVDLVGGVDFGGSYVSKNLYVKTKEPGPLGGVRRARPL